MLVPLRGPPAGFLAGELRDHSHNKDPHAVTWTLSLCPLDYRVCQLHLPN